MKIEFGIDDIKQALAMWLSAKLVGTVTKGDIEISVAEDGDTVYYTYVKFEDK